MYIVLLPIWILLIASGFFIRRSKVLVMIQSVFISGMIAANNGNPDQFQYMQLYDQLQNNPGTIFNSNIGLNLIFYISGIFRQYNISLFFICIIFMVVMYKAVKFYTNNYSFVFSLYLISPFVMDSIQVKNMLGMIIWLYFSKYLLEFKYSNDKRNLILYLLGVVLASSVHFAFLFTIIYVMVAFINNKNVIKFVASISCIFVSLVLLLKELSPISAILAATKLPPFVLLASKLQAYNANQNIGSTSARRMIVILFYVLIFAILLILGYVIKKSEIKKAEELYFFVIQITTISLIIIPLMSYSQEMYRIQRDLLLLFYAFFASLLSNKTIINEGRHLHLNLLNCYLLISSVLVAYFYLYFDSIYWNYQEGFCVLFKILKN